MTPRRAPIAWFCMSLMLLAGVFVPPTMAKQDSGLIFINTSFENACPLYWEADPNGLVHIYLVYDHERASPNRANGHWFFQIQARPGAELTLVLHNFENIYNGRKSSPANNGTPSFVSADGDNWRAIPTELTADHGLKFTVSAPSGSLYVARLPPYRLSDLQNLLKRIRTSPLVSITKIGETVEGRDLEIVRVGHADAPHRVLLRGRAHPWEPGGSWAIQGLVNRLLEGNADAGRYLKQFCVYIMPMANKDGVVRGRTRFNQLGADLNRKWDKPADPAVAPENAALETWLATMATQGRLPHLAIDLHNDSSGKLHVTRLNADLAEYLARMEVLEAVLRKHTWFTEGSRVSGNRTGTIEEGLVERYGIDACVLELNANWIAGLKDYPSARNWELFGAQLCEAFYHYFDNPAVRETP
jgi:zinc carboxypeptidase